MTTVIRRKLNQSSAKKALSKALSVKGVDTTKHCGVLKLKKDPLQIQKELRNEWQ